jgi:aurora kinase, other
MLGINKKKVYKISDFILLEKAGQGTYSEVYKAVEKSSGFVCSLKILNKEKMINMGVLDNLVREIKLSLFLNHPNLVSLYGCFSDK